MRFSPASCVDKRNTNPLPSGKSVLELRNEAVIKKFKDKIHVNKDAMLNVLTSSIETVIARTKKKTVEQARVLGLTNEVELMKKVTVRLQDVLEIYRRSANNIAKFYVDGSICVVSTGTKTKEGYMDKADSVLVEMTDALSEKQEEMLNDLNKILNEAKQQTEIRKSKQKVGV